jgi:hypothetical protein
VLEPHLSTFSLVILEAESLFLTRPAWTAVLHPPQAFAAQLCTS